MRKMSVVCDVCGGPVEKFNGAVTLASWGTLHKDACSPRCLAALLRGFAADIEKREGLKAADNVAFAAEHLEATKIPETAFPSLTSTDPPLRPVPLPLPNEPRMTGCAACEAGVPVNTENAFKHTGEGKLCKAVKGQGPCACPPSNWKMIPNDTSTPGPREVTCHACGNVWESMIRDPAKEAASTAPAPATKRRGRPVGSGKKQAEANGTAPAVANGPTNGPTNGLLDQEETPENKTERDKQMGRVPPEPEPRWCSCGRPLTFSRPSGENGWEGKWKCEEHGVSGGIMGVKDGQPMENLSQLLTDVAKLGTKLNLVDVAQWSVIKRDMLRAWVAQPEAGPPDFITLAPEPVHESAPPVEQPKYTF